MRFKRSFLASLLVVLSVAAHAGSVISTNLPAGTKIVNIDAHADGASLYANNFSDWYLPFGGNVSLTLGPGTYTFTVINSADAAARFPALTSTQLADIHGAWTYNSPWLTDYLAFDSSAINDSTQTQLFAGAVSASAASNELDAYNLSKNAGTLGQLKVSPGGRASGTVATSYTLTRTQTLVFAIPDAGVYDNVGGPSVVVQSVPEPSALAALAIGALTFLRRRR